MQLCHYVRNRPLGDQEFPASASYLALASSSQMLFSSQMSLSSQMASTSLSVSVSESSSASLCAWVSCKRAYPWSAALERKQEAPTTMSSRWKARR